MLGHPLMPKIKSLKDIVDWRLCIGCGACAYACERDAISLHNFIHEGIRPVVDDSKCADCKDCLSSCPSFETDFAQLFPKEVKPTNFEKNWGRNCGIWEGYATDEEIRFKGSSGGVLTALTLYCLEEKSMGGVLHIGQDPQDPSLNSTRLSKSKKELVDACGSRYAPASVCDSLHLVEQSNQPCAIVGKPAEISAVRNSMKLRPELAKNVGVTFSFFCAESPSTGGTHSLLKKLSVEPSNLADLKYRGSGWPGHFAPVRKGESEPAAKLTYAESWAYLQSFRPWSTHVWPDGSGELADISCGDAWYEQPDGKNPGNSIIIARTERGREIVQGAIKAGYVTLEQAEPWKLADSQPGLLDKKGHVWGRRMVLSCFGLPTTGFKGANLFHCWKQLSFKGKLQSLYGTIKRVFKKGLLKPLTLHKD